MATIRAMSIPMYPSDMSMVPNMYNSFYGQYNNIPSMFQPYWPFGGFPWLPWFTFPSFHDFNQRIFKIADPYSSNPSLKDPCPNAMSRQLRVINNVRILNCDESKVYVNEQLIDDLPYTNKIIISYGKNGEMILNGKEIPQEVYS